MRAKNSMQLINILIDIFKEKYQGGIFDDELVS